MLRVAWIAAFPYQGAPYCLDRRRRRDYDLLVEKMTVVAIDAVLCYCEHDLCMHRRCIGLYIRGRHATHALVALLCLGSLNRGFAYIALSL